MPPANAPADVVPQARTSPRRIACAAAALGAALLGPWPATAQPEPVVAPTAATGSARPGERAPGSRDRGAVREAAAAPLPAATPTPPAPLPQPDGGPLAGLSYRLLGPFAGGRVSRVAGVPGDPLTWWAATAAGGVWKSVDGGHAWSPVFDDATVSSIGAVAVAASDPNVVWVGTGEGNPRGNVGEGNGVWRSTDGGATWKHLLALEGQIGALAVDPRDPDRAWAAVLGSPFGPGEERGVYRTADGGATWRRVLFVDRDSGACDVTLEPGNPRHVWAATWQVRRRPWTFTSGGPGSGLWRSRDGGDTWERVEGHGLPDGPWGKVGIRHAPSDPGRVYALVEAADGGLYRSDDGGDSWVLASASAGLRQRAWYYSTLTVHPTHPDVAWFPQVSMLETRDGGDTIAPVSAGGWDYHDLWVDPLDPRRRIAGSDAGVSLSVDAGATWRLPPLPISQLYHVSVDSRVPYRVLVSLQDWGTLSGPSHSLHQGGVLAEDWHPVGGGEAGHVTAEPGNPELVWAGEYLGIVTRWDGRTGAAPHVGVLPDNFSGHGIGDAPWRFQWTAPIVASRHQPGLVYHAGNALFRTRDGGQTWEQASPDLSRDDAGKQEWSGGPITGDNTGVEHYGTIFALAESPRDPQVLWAGSDDGLVHVSRDGAATWQRVTPPGLPEWATVAAIEASPFDAGTAWVVADAHRLDDETPYLWVTRDFGGSWRPLARGLDREVYLHVVRADPARPGLLYLGTERGVLVSWDGGESWRSLRLDMPTVAVVDLAVAGDDLVVGTLGRSVWVLDDLGPVRSWPEAGIAAAPAGAPAADGPAAHLFAPRPTIAWRLAAEPLTTGGGAGANPPAGALVTYWLAREPAGTLTLEVRDAGGRLVRTLTDVVEERPIGPGHPDWSPGARLEPALARTPGLHRAVWDLSWEGAPYIPAAMVDYGDPHAGPQALPGEYTLRLTVDGETFTAPLTVLPDPRTAVPAADRAAMLDFQLGLVARLSEIAAMVERLGSVRDQLRQRAALLAGSAGDEPLVAASRGLADRLDAIEAALHNPEAEVTYDILAGRAGGTKLHSRYAFLLETGRQHDGPPTQGMRAVAATLDALLAAQRAALERALGEELARVQALAGERELGFVLVPRPPR